jgi:hypothetical protein
MKKSKLDQVKQIALDTLDTCIIWIKLQARTHNESALKEVMEVPEADLSKYAEDNKQFMLRWCIAQARINKEDVINNPVYVMKSLWNCTFDVDLYKQIGENDGQLRIAQRIFNVLGMKKESKACTTWMYNAD